MKKNTRRSVAKSEREQLFQKKNPDDGDANWRNREAGLASDSSELTEGLTALVRHMDGQVRQSEATLSALVGSSHTLTETETEFKDMGATIKRSGKLLSKYGRREITDKLLICLALFFYFATCVYIVKKRLINHFI